MYAQIASTPVPSKTQSPAVSVPDLDPKHVAKAGLILERLRYPSPERVLILATKKSMIPTGTLNAPSPAFVLIASDRFLMWTLIRTQLNLQHLR